MCHAMTRRWESPSIVLAGAAAAEGAGGEGEPGEVDYYEISDPDSDDGSGSEIP